MAGIRDAGLLDSAIAQPLMTFSGKELYPTLFEKTAMLGFGLIMNHPFVDGNKRVGFTATAVVLLRNGYRLNCSADAGEDMVLSLAAGQTVWQSFAAWLEEHSAPVR